MTRALSIAAVIALQLLSCGGDPPICPNGNCTLPGQTTIKFTFDAYPALGFASDSCTDLAVSTVEVDVTDGAGKVTTLVEPCDYAQATFNGLVAGDYKIAVTPLDSSGAAMVTAPAAGTVTAGIAGSMVTATVDVPYEAWIGTYTGTFLFRLSWAGASCAMAVPAVATQVLTLSVRGTVVAQVTDTGHHLDGLDSEACRAFTDQFPQSVTMVPFGPAKLTVVGKDSGGVEHQHHQFDTFVGAGMSNPTLTFDVPADAGIDGPPADVGGD